jgi:hypothetical protein
VWQFNLKIWNDGYFQRYKPILITKLLLFRVILFIAEAFLIVLKYLFVVVLLLQLKWIIITCEGTGMFLSDQVPLFVTPVTTIFL